VIEFRGLRESLSLRTVRPELVSLLKLVSLWSNRAGHNVRVNSLNDHDHQRGTAGKRESLHYSDLAGDFSISHTNGKPNRKAMAELADFLKTHLGFGYDVVFNVAGHKNHLHVEYDDNERKRTN